MHTIVRYVNCATILKNVLFANPIPDEWIEPPLPRDEELIRFFLKRILGVQGQPNVWAI